MLNRTVTVDIAKYIGKEYCAIRSYYISYYFFSFLPFLDYFDDLSDFEDLLDELDFDFFFLVSFLAVRSLCLPF